MKDKAIIFDLDGTALDSPHKRLPSEYLTKVIAHAKNKYFLCAATGRAWSFAKPVLHALKLTDPCVITAGAQICDPVTGKILWQKNISDEALNKILEVFKQYPEYKILYNDYSEEDFESGGHYLDTLNITDKVYFIERAYVPDAIAFEMYKKLIKIPEITCVMVLSRDAGKRDLHIINHETTKEHAIAELLKIINVPFEHSIGIGDGHNDLHLFNAVHHKVAMGNAVPELKTVADEVIDSVQEDGMAKYLETL